MEARKQTDYSVFDFKVDSVTKELGSDTQNVEMLEQVSRNAGNNAGNDSQNSESERSDNDPVLLDSDQESQSQEELDNDAEGTIDSNEGEVEETQSEMDGTETQSTNALPKGYAPQIQPNRDLIERLKEYIARAKRDYFPFPPEYRAAIDLMDLMDKNGCSLTLYEDLFAWHLEHLEAKSAVPPPKAA